jgi:hypothetical protein
MLISRYMRILAVGLLVVAFVCADAAAQDQLAGTSQDASLVADSLPPASSVPPRTTLTVHSNPPGLSVYVDSSFVGTTPVDQFPIDPGTRILRYLQPDHRIWSRQTVVETLFVRTGEHPERFVQVPTIYRVTSDPFGARVELHDSTLGETPLMLSLTDPAQRATVRLSKDGFVPSELVLPADGGVVNVPLQPLAGNGYADGRTMFLNNQPSKSSLPIYLTTGSTVLTGVAAAYFKLKADNHYDSYRQTGNRSSLDQVRRYDTAAGIALIASEASLLLLTYLLLSQ